MTNVNQGSYSLLTHNVPLPPLVVSVGRSGIGFTGCNTISIPFISNPNGIIKINGKVVSTAKNCAVNNDQKYVQLLLLADGYKHNGNNFFFTHRGNNIAQFNFINHQINKFIPKVNVKPPIHIIATTTIPKPINIVSPPIPHIIAPPIHVVQPIPIPAPIPIAVVPPPVPQLIAPPINIVAPNPIPPTINIITPPIPKLPPPSIHIVTPRPIVQIAPPIIISKVAHGKS
jgi:hypothetical protein